MPEELNPGQSAVGRLIAECKESITGQRHIAGYHCGPHVPILFAAFGNACAEEKMQLVKETIELAWNNIQGNLILLQYPEEVEKKRLFTEMDESIAKLKSLSEGIFRTYNSTRVYLFLEGDDPRFDSYTELLKEDLGKHFEQLQLIVVVLLNERTMEKKQEARRQLSVLARLKAERKIQGVLALSNVLQNGRIISGEEEKNQYRLAADVAFLSDSYEIATGMEYEITREIADTLMQDMQMCTAAYIKLSKPSEKIVRATLRTMLRLHEEREREYLKGDDFDNSSHGFRSRLTPKKGEGMFGLERFFREEVEKTFPAGVRLEDFPYFSEMESIRKKGAPSPAELEGIMRTETFGTWELFVRYNYLDRVREYTRQKREELSDRIRKFLEEQFSWREILAYGENPATREDIEKDLLHITPGLPNFNVEDVDSFLHRLAAERAKKLFFEETGEICKEVFRQVYEQSRKFSRIVEDTAALLGIGYLPESVSLFYEKKTEELYSFEKYRGQMNRYCENTEEYCRNLKNIFLRYAGENPKVYLTSFEEELAARIENNATGTILDNLGFKNRKLEDECRLQYGRIPEGNAYCIAFAEAAFIPPLEQQGSLMGKVFRTSRQESVERIMICPFSCEEYAEEGGEEHEVYP